MPLADRVTWEAQREQAEAAAEHGTFMAHMRKLAKIACDKTLNDEQRLKALMQLDAAIWRRRTQRTDGTTGPDDKVSLAKKAGDRALLLRQKVEAIKRGSNRVWKIVGTMNVIEQPDGVHCVVCHKSIKPSIKGRQRQTCGEACRQALHRARAA